MGESEAEATAASSILKALQLQAGSSEMAQGDTTTVMELWRRHEIVIGDFDEVDDPRSSATILGQDLVVEQLLSQRSSLDLEGALWSACQDGHLCSAQYLLAARASVNCVPDETTTLYEAAIKNHSEIVTQLLEARAAVDITSNDREMLPAAALDGNVEVLTKLLGARANVNQTNDDFLQQTPLFFAAAAGHVEVVTQLLAGGAYVDMRESKGEAPLFRAAQSGQVNIVAQLLATRASVNAAMAVDSQHSPLTVAAYKGHEAITKMLSEAGADKAYSALSKRDEVQEHLQRSCRTPTKVSVLCMLAPIPK